MRDMIITHDGRFHVDEILACVMLQKLFPNSNIIRTRNKNAIYNYCKQRRVFAVVDIFEKYDPHRGYFDHHQADFNLQINGVKCSSAGLVFKHYINDLLRAYNINTQYENRLIIQIYLNYIRMVDAKDNGIDISCTLSPNQQRNSFEYDMGFSHASNLGKDDHYIYMRTITNVVMECKTFEEAFDIIRRDFKNFMDSMKKWIKNYEDIKALLMDISKFDNIIEKKFQKQILLTEGMGNIGKIVSEIEKDNELDIQFIIDYQDNKYFIYTVSSNFNRLEIKTPLKENFWQYGYEKTLGDFDSCNETFVNFNGSEGSCKTLDDALKLCYDSLE